MPLTDSVDNHQYLNAKYYKDKGCCWLLEQDNFNTKNLFNLIMRTIKNKNELENIRENMKKNCDRNVYGNIEGLMNQFMMVIGDVTPARGHLYNYCEGANGELGFYVVSDGSKQPYRVKCRPPCFAIFQAFPELLKGHMIADVFASLGTIDIIACELDR